MKILKSIKWRLQLWYGLILVVVLAGFGVTAYQLERNRQFRRVDEELHQRFNILVEALHPPRRGADREPPPFDPLPPEQRPEVGRSGRDVEQMFHPPLKFELPTWAVGMFNTNEPVDYYFVITTRGNDLVARWGNEPIRYEMERPGSVRGNAMVTPKNLRPSPAWMIGNYREIFGDTPNGADIIIGRSILPELNELQRTALNLTAIGGLVLLVGLAGGWWFVGRALRPVSEISATAAKISAGDLSQRINVAEAESELGQLAAVLNSTFARLETAFAQQKQFASDAAHELRTPVTVMLTQTQTALNRERDAVSYKQTVEACQRAAQRMRRLIESLLELARFDAGQEILKRLHFNFSKTIADSIEMVQTLADERNLKIITEIASLEIIGDSERLAQVVTNLLTNALQYNRPGGEVRVKLNVQNGLAVLEIADTGQGIAPENLSRVFERFYRADQSRTGAGNAGLGLSICKAIVEAHGGSIAVTSQPGSGTTFTVRLPVA